MAAACAQARRADATPAAWLWAARAALVLCCAALTACASAPRERAPAAPGHWSGRLSLSVDSEPAQFLSGTFELAGSARQGDLRLISPLGSTVARLRWAAGEAILESGGTPRQFASLQAMLAEVLGTTVPAEALFAWLEGREVTTPGWNADLTRHAEGRLVAVRSEPAPRAELRVILDQP